MFVVGDRRHGENFDLIQHYVDVLCQEIVQSVATATHDILPLDTVFFGGGTPSLISVRQLHQILATLDQHLGIGAGAEISIEMDPGTFDQEKLAGFAQGGINRVSLGVQAFQDELLALCGRSHNVREIYTALDMVHQVGVKNFSIDLISGLPRQTPDHWQESLEKALALAPTHLSHYDLIVEPVTAFGRFYQPGKTPLPSDWATAQMYRLAQATFTQAGYQHYEISNYARPGYSCRHNLVYWHRQPYYGFGMGAASYQGGYRFTRPRKSQLYFEWVANGPSQQGTQRNQPNGAEWVDSPQESLLETLMLGLRLSDGLNLMDLAKNFGEKTVEMVLNGLEPYLQKGWVEFSEIESEIESESQAGIENNKENDKTVLITTAKRPGFSGRICLTDPEGFLFSNTVLASLFDQFSNFVG